MCSGKPSSRYNKEEEQNREKPRNVTLLCICCVNKGKILSCVSRWMQESEAAAGRRRVPRELIFYSCRAGSS
ncbi:hypothetical protein GN956_G26238, partial [Arapaima gigas]